MRQDGQDVSRTGFEVVIEVSEARSVLPGQQRGQVDAVAGEAVGVGREAFRATMKNWCTYLKSQPPQ